MAEYDEALVEKAARAIHRNKMRKHLNHPDCAPDQYELRDARAVLDAVAADIWDEGYAAGYDDTGGPNPYRADQIAGEQPRTREVGAGGTNGAVDGHGEGQGAEERGETMEGDA